MTARIALFVSVIYRDTLLPHLREGAQVTGRSARESKNWRERVVRSLFANDDLSNVAYSTRFCMRSSRTGTNARHFKLKPDRVLNAGGIELRMTADVGFLVSRTGTNARHFKLKPDRVLNVGGVGLHMTANVGFLV
jgi:hypothetical protein